MSSRLLRAQREENAVHPAACRAGITAQRLVWKETQLTELLSVSSRDRSRTLVLHDEASWPVHRMTHTLLGAAVVAGLVVCMMALIRQMPRLQSMTTDDGECSLWGISVGALVGTWSHVLLDSIVHLDVRLFAPFNDALPFYGLLEWEQVNLLCIVSAAVGLLLHVLQRLTARPAPTH